MHRPTRQHRNLVAKLEKKEARKPKRGRGAKMKRWAKAVETYKDKCKDEGASSAS